MNTSAHNVSIQGKTLIAAALASLLLAACAATPVKPAGAEAARARLTQLQSNPDLATRAPVAMKDAELAVRVAEQPQTDAEIANYNVYMADRKVDIAVAQAETALAEDQRVGLAQQRDKARLDARTREADVATSKLASARVEIADQKSQAETTRLAAADAAQQAALQSAQQSAQQSAELQRQAALQSAELQRQLDELHAKATDRGMVLTLGDVLFSSGRADLKVGATNNLNRLVAFLNNYPDRTVVIEGYTDNIGGDDYNLGLSQRRADSVKSYLTGQGIASMRLTSTGKGLSNPIAGNDSASGRQQNRRVEVIIDNPPAALR
ncbi:MAG: OmpA family protein [Steroidobacteraceae bacterium]|jgi:outer membrane protein OmpA-like peptidoglycan-associated protein